jgi:hypothetical protein
LLLIIFRSTRPEISTVRRYSGSGTAATTQSPARIGARLGHKCL